MSLGWVAGALRGRALVRRRLGDDGVRSLAAIHSLREALAFLAASSYGHGVRADFDVAEAQRAIAETSLWHLRVLAGWLPPSGVQALRALAGWFELLNIEGHAAALATGARWDESPLPLGALATIWPRATATTTLQQLRAVLAHSAWGDPVGDTFPAIILGLRIGWARGLRGVIPEAQAWCDGGLALALAKALFAGPTTANRTRSLHVPELHSSWHDAASLEEFARSVPYSGRWVLEDVHQASELWRAEGRWWMRVDHDAASVLRRPQHGRAVVMASAALLVTDCWRTQATLQGAARGSAPEARRHADA